MFFRAGFCTGPGRLEAGGAPWRFETPPPPGMYFPRYSPTKTPGSFSRCLPSFQVQRFHAFRFHLAPGELPRSSSTPCLRKLRIRVSGHCLRAPSSSAISPADCTAAQQFASRQVSGPPPVSDPEKVIQRSRHVVESGRQSRLNNLPPALRNSIRPSTRVSCSKFGGKQGVPYPVHR